MTAARGGALLVTLLLVTSGCHAHPRGLFKVSPGPRAAVSKSTACSAVEGGGPVVVLVHGMGGETANADEVVEELGGLEPAAVLSFRWGALEETGELVERFAGTLVGLTRCLTRGQQLVVVAHSAGGVLASLAAERLHEGQWSSSGRHVVLTVASPLAGMGYSSWRTRLLPAKPFLLTVGGKLERYAAAPAHVSFFHLRTHAAADPVMRPARAWHWPDAPEAVVPASTEYALPVDVGHDEALLWAARELVRAPGKFGVVSAAD